MVLMSREKDIRKIQEQLMGSGSFYWTEDKPKVISCSESLMEQISYAKEVLTIEDALSIVVDEDIDEVQETISYSLESRKTRFDLLLRAKVGQEQVKKLNLRFKASYHKDGRLLELVGVSLDLSYNNQRDYSTRLNDEKFYRLFGDAPIGISLLRMDGSCFLCNDSFVSSVLYKEYELKDLPFQILIDEEDQHKFINLFSNMVANKIPSFRNEFRMVNKKNEKIWHDMTVSTVKDIYDHIKYIIVMVQPSQRNAMLSPRKGLIRSIREELNDLSLRDSLSGLYNRQYVLKRLKELILVFYEKHLTFSALLVDVDEINKINEKYGYDCGDKVIHDLSDIFKSLTRDTDICARWGGEEFVILFPEMDIDTALKLGERLRNEVKNTILMWEGKELQMTVSVSVTSYTSDDTLKSFINKVDKVLYSDKANLRDSVRII